MQGIKRKRRCQIECKDHIFSIQSLKANSSKYDIKLLFCPKFQRQPLPPEQTFPQYNNDNKFYTSAFILGVDRRVLFKNQQQELMDHQKQMRDSLEKHNQLVFPRPNSKHSLCSVCKEHYKNYYFHISSEEHRQKISQSLYNTHIKNLCNLYIDLWEGAQERADEQAEKRAAEEQERRQRLAQLTIQENQQEDQSLLDVQRGDDDNMNEGAQDDFFGTYHEKPNKKYNKSAFKDDQTIPFTARTSKRSAPQGRTYTSEYLRKKFLFNQVASQNRAFRQREQRRYQRERDKLKTQRDNPENNKEFIKISEKQGDTFIIMKAAFAMGSTTPPKNITAPQIPQTPPIQTQTQTQAQTQGQFVWKRTTDKLRKDLQKAIQRLQKEKSDFPFQKYEKENKKYEIQYGEQQKYQKRGLEQDKQAEKYDFRRYNYYHYPPHPIPPYMMPPQHKHGHLKNGEHKANELKNMDDHKMGDPNKKLQNHDFKNAPPPYYYNPYMYHSIYEPYPRTEKGYEMQDKQKNKPPQKPLQYPMHYPWPYHNNPYFMPPVSIPPPHSQEQTNPNSKPTGNTSININFPMYMCPPPSMPPRYPHQPPYMGYQYPYMPPQPRQNQNYLPSNSQNGHHAPSPPPVHSSSHIPLIHPSHNHPPSGPNSSAPPAIQQPYPGYPPYIPPYPQHYQYGQHKQAPPQHLNMGPK